MLEGCFTDAYNAAMANLQVKDVPSEVHDSLRRCAARRGTTIRDVVLSAVRAELELERFLERLATRGPVELGVPAADLLAEERTSREAP